MALLIVCKAITVWTQVIFTMVVSNRLSCATRPPRQPQTTHKHLETHERTPVHNKSAFSMCPCWELHSVTIRSTQRQRGTARWKGQSSQHLHGKVKARAWNNPVQCRTAIHKPCCFLIFYVTLHKKIRLLLSSKKKGEQIIGGKQEVDGRLSSSDLFRKKWWAVYCVWKSLSNHLLTFF